MLIHWIWLATTQALELGQKLALLQHFPDPEDIYYADSGALLAVEGITPQAVEALQEESLDQAQAIYRRCQDKGIGILTLQDAAYPKRLQNVYEPPLLLYYTGHLPDLEGAPTIAVAGTRKASAYGLKTARRIGGELAAGGGLVLTGGSAGIEAIAMEGALDTGNAVAALLPCGVDVAYPSINRRLFARVRERGCLLSEYSPGVPAHKWNFRRRNYILGGMACGTLVVEAPEQSGALSIAQAAFDQGRDVFVVPANVDVPTAVGSNALMRERAMPVTSGWDILQEYEALFPGRIAKERAVYSYAQPVALVAQKPDIPRKTEPSKAKIDRKTIDNGVNSHYSGFENLISGLAPEAQTILGTLSDAPKLVDDIVAETGLPAGKVLSTLTVLAVKGLVCSHPGKRFTINR